MDIYHVVSAELRPMDLFWNKYLHRAKQIAPAAKYQPVRDVTFPIWGMMVWSIAGQRTAGAAGGQVEVRMAFKGWSSTHFVKKSTIWYQQPVRRSWNRAANRIFFEGRVSLKNMQRSRAAKGEGRAGSELCILDADMAIAAKFFPPSGLASLTIGKLIVDSSDLPQTLHTANGKIRRVPNMVCIWREMMQLL
jgi:hypothetical protein